MVQALITVNAVSGSNPPNGTALVINTLIGLDNTERFWRSVRKSEGCWEWLGELDKQGYGRFWACNRRCLAHRYSYAANNGDPAGLLVLHRCDNPKCVRPEHLFLGTQKDNIQDCVRKGRKPRGDSSWQRRLPERVSRGEQAGNSRLKESEVLTIWSMARSGMTLLEVSEIFQIDFSTVSQIKRGKTWKHITGELTCPRP